MITHQINSNNRVIEKNNRFKPEFRPILFRNYLFNYLFDGGWTKRFASYYFDSLEDATNWTNKNLV